MEMRICVASHSLVAARQYWYWDYVARQPDMDVLKLAPAKWGVHSVPWGYAVSLNRDISHFLDLRYQPGSPHYNASGMDTPDMVRFQWPPEALFVVEEFKPDIIYLHQEPYCRSTHQLKRIAKRLGCKFAFSTWENIQPYDQMNPAVRDLIRDSDLIVCATSEAENLIKPYNTKTLRLIQVPPSTEAFFPRLKPPTHQIIFQGRQVPEKGSFTLKEAAEKANVNVLWPQPDFATPYPDLPERYSKAMVNAAPSIDNPQWKEQHGSYVNLESLSCGLYVVTSDSSSIVESLQGCPGVYFTKQGDSTSLAEALLQAVNDYKTKGRNIDGRQWIIEHYGYETFTKTLLDAFRRLL